MIYNQEIFSWEQKLRPIKMNQAHKIWVWTFGKQTLCQENVRIQKKMIFCPQLLDLSIFHEKLSK